MKKILLFLLLIASVANAQVSALSDAGSSKIVQKSQSYFAKIFKRKNGSRIEYMWYTTDATGKKLPRGGKVKGTSVYYSLADAEAAIPSLYTLIEDTTPATEKLYIMGMLHYGHWDTGTKTYVVNGRNVLNDYENNGFNAVQLEMYIQDIWKQGATDRENGIFGFDKPADWSFLNERLTPLISRGFDVSIRINLIYARKDTPDDFAYHYNYWGSGFAETDEWGNVPEVDRGKVPMTLADDAFNAKMADKVKQIVVKANEILGSKLKFISTVRASTNEWGYDHRGMYHDYTGGTYNGSTEYFATFCYNPKNTAKFQSYLASAYGNNLSALNSAWGTTYSSFSQIELPKIGNTFNNGAGHTFQEANGLYANNRGYDFWMYKNYMQNKFGGDLRTAIKSVRNDLIFVGESGGFSFNLGILHGTYDIASLQQVFDLVKGSTGIYNHCLQPEEGWDFVSNPTKKFGDELSWFDLNACGFITNTAQYKINLKQRAKSSLQLGHNLFLMIDDPTTHYWSGVAHSTWTESLAAMSEIRTELGNNRLSQPANASSINITLKNALANNSGTAIKTAWSNAGGSPTNRVKINMIVEPTSGSILPSPSTVKKSEFTFVQKSNGQALPTPSDTGNGYTRVSCASHGITRTLNNMPADKGTIVKFEYEIINSANEVVASMKDNYGGFHPNFRDFPGDETHLPAESYYRVWTPSFYDYNSYEWVRDFFNNFTSISGTPFLVAEDRGNNHFDQYRQFFVNGNYTLRIRNTGEKPFELRAGANSLFETPPPNGAQVYTTVPPDNTWRTYSLYIGGISEQYKINIYNY